MAERRGDERKRRARLGWKRYGEREVRVGGGGGGKRREGEEGGLDPWDQHRDHLLYRACVLSGSSSVGRSSFSWRARRGEMRPTSTLSQFGGAPSARMWSTKSRMSCRRSWTTSNISFFFRTHVDVDGVFSLDDLAVHVQKSRYERLRNACERSG